MSYLVFLFYMKTRTVKIAMVGLTFLCGSEQPGGFLFTLGSLVLTSSSCLRKTLPHPSRVFTQTEVYGQTRTRERERERE